MRCPATRAEKWSNPIAGDGVMDLQFDDETSEFQQEVRDFLASHRDEFPTHSYDTAEGFEQHRRWDEACLSTPGCR